MSFKYLNTVIIIFVIGIIVTPLGEWMESSMLTHIIIQFPLLIACGALLATQLKSRYVDTFSVINAGGIFGLLLLTFILAFWMIPRWLDASLNDSFITYTKYLSMLLVGFLLVLSWPKTHVITRAVVKIEFLTMLFRLGWIYLISPERLCNNYLLTDQTWLGRGFLIIGFALSVSWLIPVFCYSQRTLANKQSRHSLLD